MKAMKRIIIFLLTIYTSSICFGQELDSLSTQLKHSVSITPLMGLLDDSKSAIFYRRYIKYDSAHYWNMRFGTEVLSVIREVYASGSRFSSSAFGFNVGFERGYFFNRTTFYFGVELSNYIYNTSGGTLLPTQDALFKVNRLQFETAFATRDKSSLNIFSVIGLLGLKYDLNKHISIGIEGGLGLGLFSSKFTPLNEFSFPRSISRIRGSLLQFTPNRFIFLEYKF